MRLALAFPLRSALRVPPTSPLVSQVLSSLRDKSRRYKWQHVTRSGAIYRADSSDDFTEK
ncbi:hypothetical protein L579_4436 [Pantoea sp. AS-PWVM4]|nr:hypothetical protein L579_4436 [Pantoea sp. AS-PWVM4]